MYLHVGNGRTIKKRCIIGIFDLDTATVSPSSKTMMQHMSRDGRVAYTDDDLPRSFVLYEEKDKSYHIQLSRISTSGLYGRATRDSFDTDIQ